VTKIISLTFVNLVTPKARAKHEQLFNKLASELLKILVNAFFVKTSADRCPCFAGRRGAIGIVCLWSRTSLNGQTKTDSTASTTKLFTAIIS
jgi:hypothetical protein